MKTIWKFRLLVDDVPTEIQMPVDARVLTAQMQDDHLELWVLANPANPVERRTFVVIGTGHPIDIDDNLVYVSTFQLQNGRFVFHVFELI